MVYLGRRMWGGDFFAGTTWTGTVYSLLTSTAKNSIVRAQLTDMRALAKLAEKLLVRGAASLRGVLTSPDDLLDLARHVASYGSRVLDFVELHGREGLTFLTRITKRSSEVSFRLPYDRLSHAWEHWREWKELGVNNIDELKIVLTSTIGSGSKFVYKQLRQGMFQDQIGFYDEVRNIFVAFTEHGELITAFRPPKGWSYVRNLTMFFSLK